MKKIRIDKWLWSVRIFKSRTLSTASCKSGKVKIGESNVKPSYLVQVGETVHVKKNGYDLVFKVEKLIEKRVSATMAAPCYQDLTSADELAKFNTWFIGKGMSEQREKGAGRPTKSERRTMEDYKDNQYLELMDQFDDEDI